MIILYQVLCLTVATQLRFERSKQKSVQHFEKVSAANNIAKYLL